MYLRKPTPALAGFLQALGVVLYCSLIGGFFMNVMPLLFASPPEFLGFAFMLTLFVLSAGITGSLVFAYPAYNAFRQKDFSFALKTLGFTFLFGILLLLSIFGFSLILSS